MKNISSTLLSALILISHIIAFVAVSLDVITFTEYFVFLIWLAVLNLTNLITSKY